MNEKKYPKTMLLYITEEMHEKLLDVQYKERKQGDTKVSMAELVRRAITKTYA